MEDLPLLFRGLVTLSDALVFSSVPLETHQQETRLVLMLLRMDDAITIGRRRGVIGFNIGLRKSHFLDKGFYSVIFDNVNMRQRLPSRTD